MPASRFTLARDGLRLHYFEYGSGSDSGTPVVCLPGLARTAEDFDCLAQALSGPDAKPRRRILSLDYRGRGGSAWDHDWTHYNLQTEHEDILAALEAAGIANAIFVGTSRGGLHIMLLATTQPTLLRAAVINDIGPVIEPLGLMRVKSYVGKLPPLGSWKDVVNYLRSVAGAYFTGITEADWETYARLTFREDNGRFVLRYDPALGRTLDAIGADSAQPDLWPAYEALKNVPVLGIRGENSDILSPETFADMAKRHPAFEAFTVKGQGHAPLLLDAPTIATIANFVSRVG
jgi:pimeloyl-ACP methyl ester carboxylesterase